MRGSWLLAVTFLAACSGGNSPLVTTSGTSGASATSGPSSSTTGGLSSTGSTSSSTGTTTSGASTSSTGTSTGSTSSGTTSGTTTGGAPTPPYQGFDSGTRPEPSIDVDAGCSALFPYFFAGDPFGAQCVQCRTDADCPSGLFCSPEQSGFPFVCAPCSEDAGVSYGCPAGQVCFFGDAPPVCTTDCRDGGKSCVPGICDPDTGFCNAGVCKQNSDCIVNGNGICITTYDYCAPCLPDGGGCSGPNDLCDTFGCTPNCLDSGIKCQPTFNCASSGLCVYGCQSDSDCDPVYLPFCDHNTNPPTCGGCHDAADCPGSMPGCATPITCSANCPYVCGQCAGDGDCPVGLHCANNGCRCETSAECQSALPDEPICIGLEDDGGSTLGACACLTSADCAIGQVCETRPPYQVSVLASQGNQFFGGACIASCTGGDAGYCATARIPGAEVCNSSSGYCVPCLSDSDCTINASQPIETPNCVPYPDGLAPPPESMGSPLATGGGQCGCTSTASCDDGLTCNEFSSPGACQAPCTFVDGVDSCLFFSTAFCNTFTGLCQQCLRDFDCTNLSSTMNALPTTTCATDGECVQCTDPSQCPANLPGCSTQSTDSSGYIPQGTCGFCGSVADCPADAGLVCARFKGYSSTQCLSACLPGDDAGMGSLSDAGPPCPASLPYCVQWALAQPDAGFWCGECRNDSDCASGQLCCDNFCRSNGFCP
jgi:Cys-rich repeat protein